MEEKVFEEEMNVESTYDENDYESEFDEEETSEDSDNIGVLPVILVGGAALLGAATVVAGAVKGVRHLTKRFKKNKDVVDVNEDDFKNAEDADYREIEDDKEESEKDETDED